jgi:hypothetical protein
MPAAAASTPSAAPIPRRRRSSQPPARSSASPPSGTTSTNVRPSRPSIAAYCWTATHTIAIAIRCHGAPRRAAPIVATPTTTASASSMAAPPATMGSGERMPKAMIWEAFPQTSTTVMARP